MTDSMFSIANNLMIEGTSVYVRTEGSKDYQASIHLYECYVTGEAGSPVTESKFSDLCASAFVSGDGSDRPRGFLSYPKVSVGDWKPDTIGYIKCALTADSFIDLIYALPPEYRDNGTFVMNSKVAKSACKITDGDGRFLWSDGLAAGDPNRILGYPVCIMDDMPDAEKGSTPIAFGDFKAGYTIAQRPNVIMGKDNAGMSFASKMVGGAVTNFEAIKLLKIGSNGGKA